MGLVMLLPSYWAFFLYKRLSEMHTDNNMAPGCAMNYARRFPRGCVRCQHRRICAERHPALEYVEYLCIVGHDSNTTKEHVLLWPSS